MLLRQEEVIQIFIDDCICFWKIKNIICCPESISAKTNFACCACDNHKCCSRLCITFMVVAERFHAVLIDSKSAGFCQLAPN